MTKTFPLFVPIRLSVPTHPVLRYQSFQIVSSDYKYVLSCFHAGKDEDLEIRVMN